MGCVVVAGVLIDHGDRCGENQTGERCRPPPRPLLLQRGFVSPSPTLLIGQCLAFGNALRQ
jgi:hypothetical protein